MMETRCGFVWYDTGNGRAHVCAKPQHGLGKHVSACGKTFVPETAEVCRKAKAHGFDRHYDQRTGELIPALRTLLPGERIVTEFVTCWRRCGVTKVQDYTAKTFVRIGAPQYRYSQDLLTPAHSREWDNGVEPS